ncbi:methyltransferase [Pestalotiopsis sp. NC0098]|nr:methyltransferase [Pestalotiopsis sp. NC0098]
MASSNILPVAAEEGFKDATAYDAYRPSYPPEAVEKFFKGMKLAGTSDARVVEIASGTGKFTEQLANQPERYLIKAIEPHETMRQKLAEKDLPAVEVLNGSASKMPVDNEWGDACIAAQAFHWFSTQEALDEIHRVLKPGAVFGMIWNIDNYNNPKGWEAATKWEQKLNDFVWSLDDGHSRFRHMKWKEIFEKQAPGNPIQVVKDTLLDHLPKFSLPLGEDSVNWTVWLSEDALWARINTLSQITVLKGEERENAVKVFKDALAGDDVERNEKGEIAAHGVTYFAWTDRI